jgi:putative hydrolase of the HAD superfamily
MTIQAITFDFWSTLYRYTQSPGPKRSQLIGAALAESGAGVFADDILFRAMQHAWDSWDHFWRTEQRTLDAAEWLTFVLDHIGAVLPKGAFSRTTLALERGILADTTVPVDGVAEILTQLSGRYRLGIISDTGMSPGCVLRELLLRDGLLSFFDVTIFSDEIGRSKPHPDPFHAALTALKVSPQQAVHVGDLLRTDIAGAHGVGMYAVRFAGVHEDRDVSHPDANYVIRTYDGLESALDQLDLG